MLNPSRPWWIHHHKFFLFENCWGPSSSEGPQKRNLTISSKHGLWTGTFGLKLKAYTKRKAWSWRRLSLLRSYVQGSFGPIAEKGTDLKAKRLSSPHRFFYKSIVNVKGITTISHRLCPVPINRWTVPVLFTLTCTCSYVTLVLFTFCQAEGKFVIQHCPCISRTIYC
jgi:hypothetical protein